MLAPLALTAPAAGAFDLFGDACQGSNVNSPTCQQAQSQGGDTTNRVTGTQNIINVAANVIALAAGIAAVIMIIISGLTFVTSGGNQEATATARRRLVAAVVGLLIVALAWTLIRFVTDRVVQ